MTDKAHSAQGCGRHSNVAPYPSQALTLGFTRNARPVGEWRHHGVWWHYGSGGDLGTLFEHTSGRLQTRTNDGGAAGKDKRRGAAGKVMVMSHGGYHHSSVCGVRVRRVDVAVRCGLCGVSIHKRMCADNR